MVKDLMDYKKIVLVSIFAVMSSDVMAQEAPVFQTFEDVEAHANSLGMAFQKVRNIDQCTFFDNVPTDIEDFRVYFDGDDGVAIDCFAPVRPKLRPN